MGNSSAGNFIKNVAITSTSNILLLFFGVIISIILARSLGPKDRGVYALINMLPMLIITFSNLGIGKATTYYVSKGLFCKSEVIGNNILLTILIGAFGVSIGLIVILFFQQSIFPNVPTGYFLFSLILIPLQLLITNIQYFFLGLNEIKIYNIVFIIKAVIFLILTFLIVKELRLGVMGALSGAIFSSLLALVISLYWARRIAGGISYKINKSYCKKVVKYGVQIHLGTIIAFLNYRIDIFLINIILGTTQVGFYAICVGLVEKLSIVSHTVSALLFPKIAGEKDVKRNNKITPIVARNMFWIVSFAAIALFFLCRWIILILYSEAYLPSVRPLQALLIGTIAISISSILWQDIAARGYPMLNNYIDISVLTINIVLNLLWIPKYGITGAAWASTVSYSASFFGRLFFYCRLSGNIWTNVLLPQSDDWRLYRRIGLELSQWLKAKWR